VTVWTKPDAGRALEALKGWMGQWRSVLIAYSGGVDSALVAAAAHRVLGPKALACIGVSASYPVREQRDAIALAERLGLAYRLVDTDEQSDPGYAANAANRCYFCKSHLFARLQEIARDEGWDVVLDGTHADDLGEDRPGRVAAGEKGVRSPLAELRIGKAGVRAIAHALVLPVWDKPAMACLASRVPHGTPITPELLLQIERAEDALVDLGFTQFRVRHHGDIARVELPVADMPKALTHRDALVVRIKAAGYRHVCLDLAGFRAGAAETVAAPLPIVKGAGA
jgi:uncharacterized protein